MNCKICGENTKYLASRWLTRPDFIILANFYECQSCGFTFSDAMDNLVSEQYEVFYRYPNYLNYDPHAKNEVEKQVYPRSKYLNRIVETMLNETKSDKSNYRVLVYGNGMSRAFPMLLENGFDAYAYQSKIGNSKEISDLSQYQDFFDLVVATEVAEHFVDPVTEFTSVKGLLKPNGRTAFNTGLKENWIQHANGSLYYSIEYLMGELMVNAGHVSYYSRKSIDVLSSKLGMRNLSRNSGGGYGKVLISFLKE